MQKLIKWQIVLIPYYSIGLFIRGRYISQSHVFAVIIALTFILNLIKRPVIRKAEIAWALPFACFIFMGIIGIFSSPLGIQILAKGGIQLVGISIMIIMAIATNRSMANPHFLLSITKTLMVSLAIFSFIGILQFLFWNFFSMMNVLNFSFLDNLAGGNVWKYGGMIGGLHRANSLAAEPTHFTRYLSLGLGIALIRVGMLGKKQRNNISTIVPLWASLAIIGGYFVALSINGWILFGVVVLALFFFIKNKPKALGSYIGVSIILLGILIVALSQTNGLFFAKAQTISLILTREISPENVQGNQLSALAIAANMNVALENFIRHPILGGGLGSHPRAYEYYAPAFSYFLPALHGLNAQDAASLLLRLVSETGLFGLALYVGGTLLVIIKAWRKVSSRFNQLSNSTIYSVYLGYLASLIGLLALYLGRVGHYYDPVFWIALALVGSAISSKTIERPSEFSKI
jgi:hypothetical protein